jgi:hypothetical protein
MAKGRWQETQRLLDAASAVLESEQPMTIRQLFYRLVSSRVIENRIQDYRRVSRVMTEARERGEVPWEWIVDRSRPRYKSSVWSNLEEYGEVVAQSYRKDLWQNQVNQVFILTEKDALVGSIEDVADDFGVEIRTLRGFSSATVMHEMAVRFEGLNEQGKHIVILYLGDHDPSGRDMERDIKERICKQMSPDLAEFDLKRVAIHREDICRFGLPPLRIKPADTRSGGFLKKYGSECVEVDALPASELRGRLSRAIEGLIEQEAWQRAMAVEQAERETTQRVAAALRSLPTAQTSQQGEYK